MQKFIRVVGCFAIMAMPLIAAPAHATSSHSDWSARHADMGGTQNDREELMGEKDRLKEQCMDAKGQARVTCDQKGEALRQRELAMHEEPMHEKHEAMHEEHHEKKAMKKASTSKSAAPAAKAPKKAHKKKHHEAPTETPAE